MDNSDLVELRDSEGFSFIGVGKLGCNLGDEVVELGG